MTPEEHNKYLGISHLAYGGLFGLMFIGALLFFALIIGLSNQQHPSDAPPAIFLFLMMAFMSVFYGMLIVPSMIAGYGLLKRRRWAKTASIIAGVLSGMSFPLGTAVCIYTFWFLFSEPGKILYDKPQPFLPPPSSKRELHYVPPSS